MTLHLQEGLDLRKREVLSVTQRHQLIVCAQQLEGIAENLSLIQALANACGYLGKEVQTVNVLENVGLAVGDENNVQLIQWLVYESHVILLNGGVLGLRIGELGERGEKGFNARPRNLTELAREDRFASASANGCRENDLMSVGQMVSSRLSQPTTNI
jgi:hypothetical protein